MITSIEIKRREPLAEGASFGGTGAYVKLVGVARGEVDPAHPGNRGIAGIATAPRNAHGRVEYETDVYILRPADAAKGNGRILYEVTNRGRKLIFANLCAGGQGNDPQRAAELGNALPLNLGFTLVWSGWDADAPTANGGMAMRAPVASEGGRPIVRVIRDAFVSGMRAEPVTSFRLSYPAATTDQAEARLTLRRRQGDRPETIPASAWRFLDARRIELLPAGTAPETGSIYELRYRATDAKILGLGLAATRDLVSWLRHAPEAATLLGRPVEHALAFGISQAGRYLRDHVSQGFNRDEAGRRVFDGVLAHTAGAGRVFLNEPFAQPFRTNTQHEDHDFPENAFPFSTASLEDPLTGAAGALFRGDGSDPLFMQTNTSTEYWQKGASLLHTDPLGARDVALPENARVYLVAGTQHGGRAGSPRDPGPCINPRNPHDPMPALRALLVALDEWVTDGRAPPPSRVPSLAERTLVSLDGWRFPAIPGVAVPRQMNEFGPPGDWVDPAPPQRTYRPLVPAVDGDGNELAGIRLPDIAVPRGTYTGWNLYRASHLEGELGDRDGSFLPLAATETARAQSGDPRPSVAARYASHAAYVAAVERAAQDLLRDRLLLPEDAAAYVARAREDEEGADGAATPAKGG